VNTPALVFALLLGFCSLTQAQTAEPIRTATLTWTAPTACSDGSPIAQCAVTGYIIEKQAGSSWSQVGTTAANVLRFEQSNLPLGTHTYRVMASSANGPSSPSNAASKTIAVPGAPGSVVITVTVAFTQ